MITRKRPSDIKIPIDVILSPTALGFLSGSIGILSTLIPPQLYSNVVLEPNLMFLNWQLYFLVISLTITFMISASLFSHISLNLRPLKIDKFLLRVLRWILAIVLIISLYNIYTILRSINISSIISAFAGGGGGALRTGIGDVQSDARLGWTKDFCSYLLLAPIWAAIKSNALLKDRKFLSLLVFSISVFILMTIITLTRGPLINLIIMVLTVYIISKFDSVKIPIFKLLRILSLAVLVVFGFFLFIAQARSVKTDSSDTLLRAIFGYFPASYNRAAAVVEDKLHYPNEGGFYTLQGVINPPFFGRALDTYGILRTSGYKVPESDQEDWLQQFGSVRAAGLNQAYIWATAFGWSWADIEYWSFLLFMLYGVLSSVSFKSFKQQSLFGIVFYPYVVSTILQWNAGVMIVQRSTTIALVSILFINFLLIVSRSTRQVVISNRAHKESA